MIQTARGFSSVGDQLGDRERRVAPSAGDLRVFSGVRL
jgi:hypothetical protein